MEIFFLKIINYITISSDSKHKEFPSTKGVPKLPLFVDVTPKRRGQAPSSEIKLLIKSIPPRNSLYMFSIVSKTQTSSSPYLFICSSKYYLHLTSDLFSRPHLEYWDKAKDGRPVPRELSPPAALQLLPQAVLQAAPGRHQQTQVWTENILLMDD